MSQNQQREQLGSRIGFLLLAAGCAIGLGNVWRFPYIAGAYGGALFVFIYIGFLLAVGVPILVMEFSVGRAAQRNLGAALQKLEPKGSRWHTFGPLSLIGSYLLMMFYTTVAGWMLAYCWSMLKGDLSGLTPEQVGGFFGGLISDPTSSCLWMGAAVIFCFTVCGMGLRRGVERVVKFMMVGLFALMIALVVRAVTLPGGEAGISFYLMPDPEKLTSAAPTSGIGSRATVYRSRARLPSWAATSLQALYSIKRPVNSAFMRSASGLRGSSRALFICTRCAAMSMNSLEISIRSCCISRMAAVYCSISSMMLTS